MPRRQRNDGGLAMVMPDPEWSKWENPIILRVKDRRPQTIAAPAEALSFLANIWYGERDEVYSAARKACSEVLRRRLTPQEARSIFWDFASKVGLLPYADDDVASDFEVTATSDL